MVQWTRSLPISLTGRLLNTHTHTHTHACMHTHKHIHTHARMQTHKHTHAHTLFYICTYTYRDAMTLLMLKQNVYMALGSEEKKEGDVMEVVEARLNVMQTVFLVIQTSFSLGTDILQKGQQIFQTLFDRHFTNTLEVPM